MPHNDAKGWYCRYCDARFNSVPNPIDNLEWHVAMDCREYKKLAEARRAERESNE